VGGTVSQLIVERLPSLEALETAGEEEIAAIEGLGPITARNITTWFQRPRNQQMVDKLQRAGLTLEATVSNDDAEAAGALEGLTFVITGTLTRPRRDVQAWIAAQDGKVTGSVSSKTDYLVIGEDPGGTKYNRAQELDVPMLSESDLEALVTPD
jgi:DNA ligase (NAD+)